MNRLILLFMIIICSAVEFNVSAENSLGELKGRLVNKEGEPIEGAYVFVIDDMAKQNIIANSYSNENGSFVFEAPCGNHFLGISHVGYKMVKQEMTIRNSETIDLGTLTLENNDQELQTVVVKGRAMRVKTLADGFSVDVREIAQSSNNALDLLGRLPQMRVKGNKLSVIGKEKVLLRVNNVLQRVSAEQLGDVLRGYNAALVSSVDVITSPPLKYNTDGTTALIVLHMDSKFNRYVGGNVGTEFMKGANYNGRYAVYGSGIFNNDKLFVDITPSYNHNYSYMSEWSQYVYDNGDYYLDNSPSRGDNDYCGAYATIQYQYNKQGFVGFNGNINKRKVENRFISQEQFSDRQTFNNNDINIERPRVNASVYAEHAFSKDFKGWLEAAYYNYEETTDQAFDGYDERQHPLMIYQSAQKLKVDGVTFSNDYSMALDNAGKMKLDFGIQGHYAHLSNSRSNELIHSGVAAPQQNDKIVLKEVNLNPYVSATLRPTDKLQFRLGAKLAHSNRKVDGEAVEDHKLSYNRFLPDFIAWWGPCPASRFVFAINSGNTDPKFDLINPFIWRINQNSFHRGNLGLKSESFYSYKLIYTYKGNFSVTAYVNQKRNEIKSVSNIVDGAVHNVVENAQNTIEYGLRPFYYFDRLSWMEFSVEGYFRGGVSKGLIPGVAKKTNSLQWGGNAYASFIFNRQRTFTGYVSCDYTGRQKTAVSTVDPMVDFGAGISWYLLDRKLGISLSGLNLFSSAYKGKSIRDGYTINFDNKFNYPTLYLSVTYLFNSVKDSTPRRQKTVRNIEQRL